MTDRELLEAAAKAAGLDTPRYVDESLGYSPGISTESGPFSQRVWNPLIDDGDALRLMATLNINVYFRENINGSFVIADHAGIDFCPEPLDGPHEWDATRRAIVRAAAAMAREQL